MFVIVFICLAIYLYFFLKHKRRDVPHAPLTALPRVEEETSQAVEWARPKSPLDIVTETAFFPRKLMNVGEYKVFRTVEDILKQNPSGCRVMAQVSLGEILSCDSDVYWTINSKRVDMLVIDPWGMPALAIEIQGRGHYQGNAPMRDAVKKEALRKAGVKWLEILSDDADAAVRMKIELALGVPVGSTTAPTGAA